MSDPRFDVKKVNGRTDIEVLEASYSEKMQEARKLLPEDFDFIQQLVVANLSDDELKWYCANDAKIMQRDMSWEGFEMEEELVTQCMDDEFERLKKEIAGEGDGKSE